MFLLNCFYKLDKNSEIGNGELFKNVNIRWMLTLRKSKFLTGKQAENIERTIRIIIYL